MPTGEFQDDFGFDEKHLYRTPSDLVTNEMPRSSNL